MSISHEGVNPMLQVSPASTTSAAPARPLERPVAEKSRAAAPARDWPLSGANELFRGIYTRAGIDASQLIAVSSAIDGEGKTTLSLGLAATIAQDFPDRRVLLVE